MESSTSILPHCSLLSCASSPPSELEHRRKAVFKGVQQCLCLCTHKREWEDSVKPEPGDCTELHEQVPSSWIRAIRAVIKSGHFPLCTRKVMSVAMWIVPVMPLVYTIILFWSTYSCLLQASFITLCKLFKFPWLWQDLGAYKTPPGRCRRLFTSLTDSFYRLWEFAGIMTSKTLYESKIKTSVLLH